MDECKPLTDYQVSSIGLTKLLLEEPMEEIRKGLPVIDEGCPDMHFTNSLPVTVFDSECDLKTNDSRKAHSVCKQSPTRVSLILMSLVMMNLLYPSTNYRAIPYCVLLCSVAASCSTLWLSLCTTHCCAGFFLICSLAGD